MIKTAIYWHTELWSDATNKNVSESFLLSLRLTRRQIHYIVDKPWKARQAPNSDDQRTRELTLVFIAW
jgi:hypothetical protein